MNNNMIDLTLTEAFAVLPLLGIIPALLFGCLEGKYLSKGNYITNKYKLIRNSIFVVVGLIVSYVVSHNLYVAVSLLFCLAASFFLVFDYTLNYFWGKPIGYLGNTAKTDKMLNNLFERNKVQYVFLVRVFILFFFMIIYHFVVEYL